jgi:hypothetical protein
VAVGGWQDTGVGGVGVFENGALSWAEKPNCAASFKAGPVLAVRTATMAPFAGLAPELPRLNCHCRCPLSDVELVTASVVIGTDPA